jgi:hypothetical protein
MAVRKPNVSLMVIMGMGSIRTPPRGIGQRQRKFDVQMLNSAVSHPRLRQPPLPFRCHPHTVGRLVGGGEHALIPPK